jgi:TrpR-related protein YerC/YecD
MPKKNVLKMEETKDLFKSIISLKSIDEAKRFFRDLLTEQELVEFGSRWKAAQMLNQKISYSKIEKETGLSSTTVARISKWLNEGLGGYKLMLKKQHQKRQSFGKGLR